MSANLPDTIAAASRLIEARELSPVELVDELLQWSESIDPVLNSFITATGEAILALENRGPGLLAFIKAAFEIGRARLGV